MHGPGGGARRDFGGLAVEKERMKPENDMPTTRVLRLGKLGRSNAAPLRGPLCGGEEFDFDPAGFAAVEEFVGVDGGS